MATLEFKNINKIYNNNVQAVFDFNLKIKDREFVVLVGPSGCGKTTIPKNGCWIRGNYYGTTIYR